MSVICRASRRQPIVQPLEDAPASVSSRKYSAVSLHGFDPDNGSSEDRSARNPVRLWLPRIHPAERLYNVRLRKSDGHQNALICRLYK